MGTVIRLISVCSLFAIMSSFAAEEPAAEDPAAEEKAADQGPPPEVHYYDLDPNIITNYQKPPSRKLGFITIDVQFQVNSIENLDLLEYHKPLVEHTLINVINGLDEELVKSLDRRDEIREIVKVKLSEVLKEETGSEIVENVLFTKFIYQ
ncbi:flagellar basal body-associated FliL family protein [Pleionea sediminis]|uniref:flagellar basal body-associated FliL family protein n=1 Tax=Pleionea sediminis TaxID=2569479 RepID=UPI0013DDB4B7|nr:flagellar basal body-associated FliL family protein [Pleionea sediminis]